MHAHGIGADLPPGFEGRIFTRQGSGIEVANPVAQFATFPLPDDVGDFGGGAVNLMGNDDIFVVLFEYGTHDFVTGFQKEFERVKAYAMEASKPAAKPKK